MNTFYSDQNYAYPELCIVKEIFDIANPGIVKCYVPVLMPLIKQGEPKEVKFRPSNTHLDNEDRSEIQPSGNSYTSNYILVKLPNHITDVTRDISIVPKWTDTLFDFPEDVYPPDNSMSSIEIEDEEPDIDEDLEDDILEVYDVEEIEDDEVQDDQPNFDITGTDFTYKFTPDMFEPKNPIMRELGIRKRYFFPLEKYDSINKKLYSKKDQKFIIIFIGGDISNIKIIGRYEECQSQEPTVSPTYSVSEEPWISHITELQ